MNNYQLQCIIDCDVKMKKNVVGVFPADRIPKRHSTNPYGMIVNTDPHHLPGRHWVAFFINNDHLEAFDSYGHSPGLYSINLMQFMQRFRRVTINTKELQDSKTNVCGQFCLYYLMCRCRGYSMSDIVNTFSNDLALNDQFVYTFINDRYYCCMHHFATYCQICTNKST